MSERPGPTDLENQLLQLCGLSALLGPGLLRRALADVGASNPPTAKDLERALPKLETRLLAYLPRDEVAQRSAYMHRVLSAAKSSTRPPGEESEP